MQLIGSIDQGTQSTRFTLHSTALDVVESASVEHRQQSEQPGWCEHDPVEILKNTYSVIKKVMKKRNSYHCYDKLACIGITNQRETVVVWDKYTGDPLHNAIVWLDTRTNDTVEELIATHGSKNAFQHITGLPINSYFSGVKIKWLIDNVRQVSEAVKEGRALFGTIDTWLIWNLTGGVNGGSFITDITNASRTLMMNIKTFDWDPFLMNEFGVKRENLARIVSNCEDFGVICNKEVDVLKGVHITGSAGDQQAACVGQGLEKGDMKCTFGTGAFLLAVTGDSPVLSQHGLLTTPCYKLGATADVAWALEGCVFIAGSAVTWLQKNMKMISSPRETEALLESVADTDGLVYVPPFSGLSPLNSKSDASPTLFGLNLHHTKAHFVRAMLESVAFMTFDVVQSLKKELKTSTLRTIRVDGGMTKNSAFMQLCADIIECEFVHQGNSEITSVGAAVIAGLHTGIWDSLESVKHAIKPKGSTWYPTMPSDCRRQKVRQWSNAVQVCKGVIEVPDTPDSSEAELIL